MIPKTKTTPNILQKLQTINQTDTRQQGKIKYTLNQILGITFIAMTTRANNFVEIALHAKTHKPQIQKYFPTLKTTPSHDTILRIFATLDPQYIQAYRTQFNQMLNTKKGEELKKDFKIDGKTQKNNGNSTQKPNHIVSAINENNTTISEKLVNDKSNEITAIPKLLDSLDLEGSVVTMDAMGTQKDIVAKIRKKKADYVLALKANQEKMYNAAVLFFSDPRGLAKCVHYRSVEKARGCLEERDYWQCVKVDWLVGRSDWAGLRSVVRVCCRVTRPGGGVSVKDRYFISSLGLDVVLVAGLVCGRWGVEVMHWFLDVLFLEDFCRVRDKVVAFNLNVMRKLVLDVLKLLDVGFSGVRSLSCKRFVVGCDSSLLDQLLL